jgi:hypothetical protein
MSIITIGIDLAKSVFAVHGVNEAGRAELVKPKVSRAQLRPLKHTTYGGCIQYFSAQAV